MRILFWGSPTFAVPSLETLADRHQLVGVVTQPDRPAGRGRRRRPSSVKVAATELGLPVLQPERARSEEFRAELARLRPELSVVAAYGQILVDEVLSLPERGSINLHASLLPELRGASPVNWAIIRGHDRTGITIMRMVRELDAGPILHQVAEPIAPGSTAGEVAGRLSLLGAEALVEALEQMEQGGVEEREQDHERATYAPKLSREAARLDWSLPAEELERWIRGCDPWPAAWSQLDDTPVQLFQPTAVDRPEWGPSGETTRSAEAPSLVDPVSASPGTVLVADPRAGLTVAAREGALRIGAVKPAGRSRMSSAAWIRGRGVRPGDRLR